MKKTISLLLSLTLLLGLLTAAFVPAGAAAEADAKSVFAAYVAEAGNKVTQKGLLEKLQALDAAATIEDFFVRYAVDGVFDEDESYPLSIPGNDGYVVMVATIDGVKVNATATIPTTPISYTIPTRLTPLKNTIVFTSTPAMLRSWCSPQRRIAVLPTIFCGVRPARGTSGRFLPTRTMWWP